MKATAAGRDLRGGIEKELARKGLSFAGVDEVGRGCIAGPVYAACVVLDFPRLIELDRKERDLIRDSKRLTREQRARILPLIEEIALAWHVGIATVEEIERINILQATFMAMRRAIYGAKVSLDHWLLVDGNTKISGYDGPQLCVVKGDSKCYSIAAASIIAKEARDAYMQEQAQLFPDYGFAEHVGYATPGHLDRIAAHGPCPLHRRTFEPIRSHVSRQGTSVMPLLAES
jgi:ribonuclease HII